jgi:hypothetical protein
MHSVLNDFASGIIRSPKPPCLSLYQPTHRRFPQNQQDPIRFRNLLKSLEQSLGRKYTARETNPLLEPFRALADDGAFWNHTLDGLAVLGATGLFRVYRLQRPVPELAVAADTFHLKPLIRIVQSADGYQVLGLNLREIKLFEGNRDALDQVELARGVPRTITDALGEELTEPHLTVASYGTGAGGTPMRHGHGSRKEEIDIDAERFFRAVDRAVLEHHSKPAGLPLILAALPEHHSLFRQVSQNPFLLKEAIDKHPDALDSDLLRQRAWRMMEPYYLARLAGLVEQFGKAQAQGLGSGDLALIAQAAATGRVATALIEADRHIGGRIDRTTGNIEPDELEHPEVDDLLDDLAELVMQQGGEVVIVPAPRMPVQTGAAAIYRF